MCLDYGPFNAQVAHASDESVSLTGVAASPNGESVDEDESANNEATQDFAEEEHSPGGRERSM
jgi:hypothetical protein